MDYWDANEYQVIMLLLIKLQGELKQSKIKFLAEEHQFFQWNQDLKNLHRSNESTKQLQPSMYPLVKFMRAIVLLDSDGQRIAAKYYPGSGSASSTPALSTAKEQRAFECRLLNKTSKNPSADILMFEGFTCVFRTNVDLLFCVLGDTSENELFLNNVLYTLYDAVSIILRKNVEKRSLLEYLDVIFILVDELCDNGVVIETDANQLVARVGTRVIDETSPMEGSVTQVLQQASQQFKWALLK